MPKVVESKLIFKGEDQLSPKLEHIIDTLERLGQVVEKVSDRLSKMGQGTGGGGGKTFAMAGSKDGAGKAAGGSPRSSFADQDFSGKMVSATPGKSGGQYAGKLYPGWHSGMRFAGGMMGAAGGVVSGITHQVSPAIGGMLSSAGGALSSVSFMGAPVGAALGLPMMAAGAIMTAGGIAAQPAMQHYEQFADTYRLLGEDKSAKLRSSKMFRPDEAMKFGGMLNKVGAFAGFGTMERMRMGPLPPDALAQFFTSATQAGAAGKMGRTDYDKLGKAVVFGLEKAPGQVSQTQSLETLTGLMQISAEHLGDLDENQVKELTALTTGLEAQRSSALMRGPAGVRTMGGMMGVVGGEGSTAEEMFKWQTFQKKNPGGSYTEYLRWKSGAGGTMDVLQDLEGMGEMGGIMGMRMFGKNYPAMMGILKAARESNTPADETMRRLEEAKNKDLPEGTVKGGKYVDMAKEFTELSVIQKKDQLKFSEEVMKPYMEMETNLIKTLSETVGKVLPAAVAEFAKATKYLADHLQAGDFAESLTKDVAKGAGSWTMESFQAFGNLITLGGADVIGKALGNVLYDVLHPRKR